MESAQNNYAGVWGNRLGFGNKAAVLVVDFLKAYNVKGAPLYAEGVVEAIKYAPLLLEKARKCNIPILHTRILYHAKDCTDGGMWVQKSPVMKAMVEGNPLAEFIDEVTPLENEPIFTKQYASAFFGTALASYLTAQKIDTLLIAGCSTSGCIRASAVDAVQYGFRPIVIRECVGDRHQQPHEANLFDIDSKYGDVISLEEAFAFLEKD